MRYQVSYLFQLAEEDSYKMKPHSHDLQGSPSHLTGLAESEGPGYDVGVTCDRLNNTKARAHLLSCSIEGFRFPHVPPAITCGRC
jgi:hypothetical protein